MRQRFLPVAAALASLALVAAPAAAENPVPAISVSGEANVSVAPDLAQIDGGVTSEAKTAREASEANNAAMGRVLQALKVPETMRFVFHGNLPPYLMAKDLILAVIGEIGVDGATYRSMYFAGDGISSLTLEDRMTLTNMAIEAGGKNGVCDVDEKTLDYVRNRSNIPNWQVVKDQPGAQYFSEHEWDLGTMEPMVAKPHSPDNKDTAHNCRDVKVLLVVNPSESVDKARNIRVLLHHTLGQFYSFIEIAFAGNRIKPGKIVGRNDRIGIQLQRFLKMLDCLLRSADLGERAGQADVGFWGIGA